MEAEQFVGGPPAAITNRAREREQGSARRGVAGVRIEIDGLVQGVGFRPWVYSLAQAAALRGRVWNHGGGVTVEAFGDGTILTAFIEQLRCPPMPAARVRTLSWAAIGAEHPDSFAIVASHSGAVKRPSIPPDLATCDDCRRELEDPNDRRYHYAFINCTRCGPRYTIGLDVPYDRSRTTMAMFSMCPSCLAEYEDPTDRRFHAQPNACPKCGPQLRLVDAAGRPLSGDPVATAAALLREGKTVAVKGLGGYHLACDASNEPAVAELRRRKHRDAKPFAVMVPDLAAANRLAVLSSAERDLLTAASRPIVLAERRSTSGLATLIAPGSALVGLMLPYTPLHILLLDAVGAPLVMTSGNRSDEPMACDDDEALHTLGSIADVFLQHDRTIANRCDDSVARVLGGRVAVLRRSRGWGPSSLRVTPAFPKPLLACGAHLKNTFCIANDDLAWLGPHIGDLETDEACRGFESLIERFQRFVGVSPGTLVHDLHPDYFTTRWAREQPDVQRMAVQHHHAHIASAMAEHQLSGPVIGLAWDGTGYGHDGTAWGGEVLVANLVDFVRVGTLRPIALPGADLAIREVWRIALALLDDAYDGRPPLEQLRLFESILPAKIDVVRRLLASRFNTPLAHGVGRYFDAWGALLLGQPLSRFEGEVATRLEFAAGASERQPYRFEVVPGSPPMIDLRSAVRSSVSDLLAGTAVAAIAARIHATLAAVAVEMVGMAERAFGRLPVVLTGGCFQNARLVADVLAALERRFTVHLHEQVPPNDGGIALGQAMIAAARLRGDPGLLAPAAHGGL